MRDSLFLLAVAASSVKSKISACTLTVTGLLLHRESSVRPLPASNSSDRPYLLCQTPSSWHRHRFFLTLLDSSASLLVNVAPKIAFLIQTLMHNRAKPTELRVHHLGFYALCAHSGSQVNNGGFQPSLHINYTFITLIRINQFMHVLHRDTLMCVCVRWTPAA